MFSCCFYGTAVHSLCLKPEVFHVLAFAGAHFPRVETALFVSGKSAGQRNDCAALVSFCFRHYLDRPALFLQSGSDTGDEAGGSSGERENLSGADVQGDELVPLVGGCDCPCRAALFPAASFRRCEKRGRSFACGKMAGLVAAGLDRRIHFYLCVATPRKRIS